MKPNYLLGHIEICRFDHWIKNIFILPGLLIASSVYPQAIDLHFMINVLIGFLSAGLVASSNYVVNEVLDAPFDALHPSKCQRPTPIGGAHV